MANDNALSFVGKIKTAYKAAQKADGEALKYAIECGEQLALAFENVEAAKGKWKSWCSDNIPEIPQTTENLYRRLASAHADDESIFVDCKSIRDAIKKLPKRERKPKKNGDKPAKKNSNALLSGSPDLKSLLENCGADEIGIALRDTDKLDEVATASIARLSPDKLSDTLIGAWNAEQLSALASRLTAHLKTLGDDLNIPSQFRHAPSAPRVQPN
jgi:hypothetical protein